MYVYTRFSLYIKISKVM